MTTDPALARDLILINEGLSERGAPLLSPEEVQALMPVAFPHLEEMIPPEVVRAAVLFQALEAVGAEGE
jgi:hypothetical protein